MRRNLHHAPSDIRKLAYTTYVRSQLEFASAIWSPYHQYLINKIEAIQNRAARFISRNYKYPSSVSEIKLNLSLHPLDLRRNISLLCLFHKYVYNSAHSKIHLKVPTNISRRVNNQHSFSRQYGKTDAFNLSALPMAIRLWNGLPDNIAAESKGDAFRNLLHAHFFS